MCCDICDEITTSASVDADGIVRCDDCDGRIGARALAS